MQFTKVVSLCEMVANWEIITSTVCECLGKWFIILTLLHSKQPKLHSILAILSAIGFRNSGDKNQSLQQRITAKAFILHP